MITLHRLGHAVEQFDLNHDLIMTVEANPDTVITLVNGHKIIVAEPPERVAAEIQRYRAAVLADAMTRRHELRAERAPVRRINPLRATPLPTETVQSASEHQASA
jgi:flagellar protein FlbD